MSAVKMLARKHAKRAAAARDVEGDSGPVEGPVPLIRAPASKRAKVLAIESHGGTSRFHSLLEDWLALLPHVRKDCKLEQKDRVDTIPEIAELAGCNRAIFFEVRKHSDLYVWMGHVPRGPSVKFLAQAVRPMDDLAFTGNCLRGSRGIVAFDGGFGAGAPSHLHLIREVLTAVFAVPEGHPKSKPFVDHIHSFSLDPRATKIHYRHYQIAAAPPGAGGEDRPAKGNAASQILVEIGPRCTFTPVRIFGASFGGATLFANKHFVSPNHVRAELLRRTGDRYASKVKAREARNERHSRVERQLPEDELAGVFRTGGDSDSAV